MPQIGFTGISPYKKHGKAPVKLPLRSNLTPLVTSTYLDLADLNSGCWTCLPQVAHTTLNPSIETLNVFNVTNAYPASLFFYLYFHPADNLILDGRDFFENAYFATLKSE